MPVGLASPEEAVTVLLKSPQVIKLENTPANPVELKDFLETKFKSSLEVRPGATKNAYINKQDKEVIFIINTDLAGPVLDQARYQIDFYSHNMNSEAFKKIVPQIKGVIEDGKGNMIGMVQEYFAGMTVPQYLQKYGRIPQSTIDAFVQNYQSVIEATKEPHGDLVLGIDQTVQPPLYLVDWKNLLINKDGELKFIDYCGRGGSMAFRSPDNPDQAVYSKSDNRYNELVKSDPQRVKQALYRINGYN